MTWAPRPCAGTEQVHDAWMVTNGKATVGPFTKGHAQSVADGLNERENLRMALSLSSQLAVSA